MNETPSLHELIRELDKRCQMVDAAVLFLTEQSVLWAEAEHEYRKHKATAILEVSGTVQEREAQAEQKIGRFRYERDKTLALKEAAMESLRSRRAQLSAVQSICNAVKAEMELGGKGPEVRP